MNMTHLCRAVLFLVLLVGLNNVAEAKKQGARKGKGGPTKEAKEKKMKSVHHAFSGKIPKDLDTESSVTVEISEEDETFLSSVDAEDVSAPLTIGVVKRVEPTVGKPMGKGFKKGKFMEKGDETVWAVKVSSRGAEAMRIHIEDLNLPLGTVLVVLGKDNRADGPYVQEDIDHTGDLWTRTLDGDEHIIVVQHSEKDQAGKRDLLDALSLTVTEIAHVRGAPKGGRNLQEDSWPCGSNPQCFLDAQCNVAANAKVENAKLGIARMEWIADGTVKTCTGALIADDDDSSQSPYMLTARHCLAESNANLQTFFSFTTDGCEGRCPGNRFNQLSSPIADTVGATLISSSRQSDYALFRLTQGRNSAIPANAVYLGWNSSPVQRGSKLHRFSNPNWGPLVYTEYLADDTAETCGLSTVDFIFSEAIMGGTMGGSSGSPVLNSDGEVVGQLLGKCGFGGGDMCSHDVSRTVDGAFASYFPEVESILVTSGRDGGDLDGDNDGKSDPSCSKDSDCDDGNPCTTNTCDNIQGCVSVDNRNRCDDGDRCTAGDTCSKGSCVSGTNICDKKGKLCRKKLVGEKCKKSKDCCSRRCKKKMCVPRGRRELRKHH